MSFSHNRQHITVRRICLVIACFTMGPALSLLLTGCWWPEKFNATLDINRNRSYVFRYDGLLTFSPAIAEIKQSGRLEPRAELDLNEAAKELAAEDGFRSVHYLGNGRYQVRYEKSGVIDRQIDLLGDSIKILSLRPTPDGIQIAGIPIGDDTRRQLAEIGLGLDGHVRIRSALKVLEQNAQDTPLFGGLVGAYDWRITVDTPPVRLTLSQSPSFAPVMEKSTFLVLVSLAFLMAVIISMRLAARRSTRPELDSV